MIKPASHFPYRILIIHINLSTFASLSTKKSSQILLSLYESNLGRRFLLRTRCQLRDINSILLKSRSHSFLFPASHNSDKKLVDCSFSRFYLPKNDGKRNLGTFYIVNSWKWLTHFKMWKWIVSSSYNLLGFGTRGSSKHLKERKNDLLHSPSLMRAPFPRGERLSVQWNGSEGEGGGRGGGEGVRGRDHLHLSSACNGCEWLSSVHVWTILDQFQLRIFQNESGISVHSNEFIIDSCPFWFLPLFFPFLPFTHPHNHPMHPGY